jgi:hypothetical protein
MQLSSADAGMMIYQTTTPKGIYSWDGTNWIYHAPMETGGANGHTLRWDGNKWSNTSNFFNNGSAVAIGMTSPNFQFQISSGTGPNYTRIQLTNFTSPNSGTGNLSTDGFIIGIGAALNNGVAHIIQQEEKALWFGTNALERMRIDSAGNVGINNPSPNATLDVNGSVKIGADGSILQGIMRADVQIDPPMMESMTEWSTTFPFANADQNAVVYVSPGSELDGLAVCYARVSEEGVVNVKIMYMGEEPEFDPPAFILHVVVIQ